jgi:hypothetical protein
MNPFLQHILSDYCKYAVAHLKKTPEEETTLSFYTHTCAVLTDLLGHVLPPSKRVDVLSTLRKMLENEQRALRDGTLAVNTDQTKAYHKEQALLASKVERQLPIAKPDPTSNPLSENARKELVNEMIGEVLVQMERELEDFSDEELYHLELINQVNAPNYCVQTMEKLMHKIHSKCVVALESRINGLLSSYSGKSTTILQRPLFPIEENFSQVRIAASAWPAYALVDTVFEKTSTVLERIRNRSKIATRVLIVATIYVALATTTSLVPNTSSIFRTTSLAHHCTRAGSSLVQNNPLMAIWSFGWCAKNGIEVYDPQAPLYFNFNVPYRIVSNFDPAADSITSSLQYLWAIKDVFAQDIPTQMARLTIENRDIPVSDIYSVELKYGTISNVTLRRWAREHEPALAYTDSFSKNQCLLSYEDIGDEFLAHIQEHTTGSNLEECLLEGPHKEKTIILVRMLMSQMNEFLIRLQSIAPTVEFKGRKQLWEVIVQKAEDAGVYDPLTPPDWNTTDEKKQVQELIHYIREQLMHNEMHFATFPGTIVSGNVLEHTRTKHLELHTERLSTLRQTLFSPFTYVQSRSGLLMQTMSRSERSFITELIWKHRTAYQLLLHNFIPPLTVEDVLNVYTYYQTHDVEVDSFLNISIARIAHVLRACSNDIQRISMDALESSFSKHIDYSYFCMPMSAQETSVKGMFQPSASSLLTNLGSLDLYVMTPAALMYIVETNEEAKEDPTRYVERMRRTVQHFYGILSVTVHGFRAVEQITKDFLNTNLPRVQELDYDTINWVHRLADARAEIESVLASRSDPFEFTVFETYTQENRINVQRMNDSMHSHMNTFFIKHMKQADAYGYFNLSVTEPHVFGLEKHRDKSNIKEWMLQLLQLYLRMSVTAISGALTMDLLTRIVDLIGVLYACSVFRRHAKRSTLQPVHASVQGWEMLLRTLTSIKISSHTKFYTIEIADCLEIGTSFLHVTLILQSIQEMYRTHTAVVHDTTLSLNYLISFMPNIVQYVYAYGAMVQPLLNLSSIGWWIQVLSFLSMLKAANLLAPNHRRTCLQLSLQFSTFFMYNLLDLGKIFRETTVVDPQPTLSRQFRNVRSVEELVDAIPILVHRLKACMEEYITPETFLSIQMMATTLLPFITQYKKIRKGWEETHVIEEVDKLLDHMVMHKVDTAELKISKNMTKWMHALSMSEFKKVLEKARFKYADNRAYSYKLTLLYSKLVTHKEAYDENHTDAWSKTDWLLFIGLHASFRFFDPLDFGRPSIADKYRLVYDASLISLQGTAAMYMAYKLSRTSIKSTLSLVVSVFRGDGDEKTRAQNIQDLSKQH